MTQTDPRPAFDRELIRRRGFAEFVRRGWAHVDYPRPPPLIWDWHLEEQANHWEGLFRGVIEDLVINVPPGHAKTSLAMVLFPAWIWTEDPAYKLITLSYDKGLALDAAKQCVALICSEWYQARWPHVQIVDVKRRGSGNVFLKSGGQRFTTFLGGAGTGRHGHMLIADDPLKAQDAYSPKIRANLAAAEEKLASTFGSRSMPGAVPFKRGLVMQRLHQLDPSQSAIDQGACHLMLPAFFEPERRCVTVLGGDRRTREGEVLAPRAKPERELLATIKKTTKGAGLESPAGQSQFQQRPSPPNGAIFKPPFLHFDPGQIPASTTSLVLAVDCTFDGKPTSDFVGLEVWGAREGHFYLYASTMKRLTFHETVTEILAMAAAWRILTVVIEVAANGAATIEALKLNAPLLNVVPSPISGGLVMLANTVSHYFAQGRVHIAESDWAAQKERNLASYPAGVANDDDTSATCHALRYMAEAGGDLQGALEQWASAGLSPSVPRLARAMPGEMFAFQPDPAAPPTRAPVGVYLWPHSVDPAALAALDATLRMCPAGGGFLDTEGGTVKAGGWVLCRCQSPVFLAIMAVHQGYVARAGEFVLA